MFTCFVVRLRECSIRLLGISGKTLKLVSFHTGSRGVLYKIFEGIQFQQTHNTIACLQFDHVHWFESTTDRFTLQLCGEFNWKYGQIGLFCSMWFLNFIQWSSCKQLTNWEDWILRALKIIETNVSRTIQIQCYTQDRIQNIPSFSSVHFLSINEHAPSLNWQNSLLDVWMLLENCCKLTYHSFVTSWKLIVTLVLHADWMMLKNASNQRGVNSMTVTTWLMKYRLRMFELFC